jgi:hypothetical protein
MAIVRTFNSEIEAEMAMSALEAAGIESVMRRDDAAAARRWDSRRVQVVVADEEMEAATEVLDAPPIEFGGPLDGDLES